jgi:hypothetical protein
MIIPDNGNHPEIATPNNIAAHLLTFILLFDFLLLPN